MDNYNLSLDSVESLEQYLGNLSTITDNDPSLVSYIQKKLLPPAPRHVPLKIYGDIKTGQIGQAEEILKYFNGKKNGVFVEAGAWNGEYLSNTLYLEVQNTNLLYLLFVKENFWMSWCDPQQQL